MSLFKSIAILDLPFTSIFPPTPFFILPIYLSLSSAGAAIFGTIKGEVFKDFTLSLTAIPTEL